SPFRGSQAPPGLAGPSCPARARTVPQRQHGTVGSSAPAPSGIAPHSGHSRSSQQTSSPALTVGSTSSSTSASSVPSELSALLVVRPGALLATAPDLRGLLRREEQGRQHGSGHRDQDDAQRQPDRHLG